MDAPSHSASAPHRVTEFACLLLLGFNCLLLIADIEKARTAAVSFWWILSMPVVLFLANAGFSGLGIYALAKKHHYTSLVSLLVGLLLNISWFIWYYAPMRQFM